MRTRRQLRLPRLGRVFALAAGLATAAALAAPAAAEPIAFTFDEAVDEPLDPYFAEHGLMLFFLNDDSVNTAGHVQQLHADAGPPPAPFHGAGHLRLTSRKPGGLRVTSRLVFSQPVRSFELRAVQIGCYDVGRLPAPSRCFNPLLVEAWGEAGQRLATLRTTRFAASGPGAPAPDAGDYERLAFSSEQPIHALVLRGDSNRSAFDELSVETWDPMPLPCGLGFELVPALALLLRRRGRRRQVPRRGTAEARGGKP